MRISQPIKILLGILTAWMVIYPILLFLVWFTFVFFASNTENPSYPGSNIISVIFFPSFFLIICSSFLHIGLQVFYIIHVILNKAGADIVRALLGVGLFILPFIAMPVYYLIYILPENPPIWSLSPHNTQITSTNQAAPAPKQSNE